MILEKVGYQMYRLSYTSNQSYYGSTVSGRKNTEKQVVSARTRADNLFFGPLSR